jgi:phosphate transport system substrate-binding protein
MSALYICGMKKVIQFLKNPLAGSISLGMSVVLASVCVILMMNLKETRVQVAHQEVAILNENIRLMSLKRTISGGTHIREGLEVLVSIHGSNTLGDELVPNMAKAYLKKIGAKGAPQMRKSTEDSSKVYVFASFEGQVFPLAIEIVARGSETAFSSLSDNSAELGMSSRMIQEKDKIELDSVGVFGIGQQGTEHVIALDGIAIVVHPSNKVQNLSLKSLRKIFSGQITNWKELGGADLAIHVFIRDKKSGTRKFFKELILDTLEFDSRAKDYNSHEELSQVVSQIEGAIGFVSLPYIGGNKALSIETQGGESLLPSSFSVATEDYLISRRLYIYNRPTMTNLFAKEFLDFSLSKLGQDWVQKTGFVALDIKDAEKNENGSLANSNMPQAYKNLVKGATRLSLNLRFRANGIDLDEKGQRDLFRLAERINADQSGIRKLWLVGFSDSTGSREKEEAGSLLRAQQVWSKLKPLLHFFPQANVKTIGFGGVNSLESNSTLQGQAKNRRVEVWIERNSL